MENQGPSYEDGHLFVAAIRILESRLNRPPSVEEVGEFLGRSNEIAHMLVRGLEAQKIVRIVKTPFDTHLEIVDHLKLEDLSKGRKSAAFGDALNAFQEKKQKEQEAMEAFFASGGDDEKKKKKMDSLDNAFQKFQKSKRDIFAEDEEE